MAALDSTCPMGDALFALPLIASAVVLFTPKQDQGVALVERTDGKIGLLRWTDADAYKARDLAGQIRWGRAYELLPLAVEAERGLGLAEIDGADTVSAQLRAHLRAVS